MCNHGMQGIIVYRIEGLETWCHPPTCVDVEVGYSGEVTFFAELGSVSIVEEGEI